MMHHPLHQVKKIDHFKATTQTTVTAIVPVDYF